MPRIRAKLVKRYPQFVCVFKCERKIESRVLVRSRPANGAAKMNLDLLKRLRSMSRSADGETMGNGVLKFRFFVTRCLAEQSANSLQEPAPATAPRTATQSAMALLKPGRSSRSCLLACCAGVHVDFHAHRHFNDLRCFPGHLRTPKSAARLPQ